MELPDIVGAAGVTFILVALVANVPGRMERTDRSYLLLNLVGASLACASSMLIGFVPFVGLEGIWAAVALAGLLNLMPSVETGAAVVRPRRAVWRIS